MKDYELLATKIRAHSLQMTHDAKSSHIGSCLSIADILAVLYGGVLNVRPEQPEWENRDRFILSKGHACAALYAVLAERGFFPMEWLDTFYQNGSKLSGHITYGVPGVELSTGSLGHGLSMGCGMALAAKRDNKKYKIFVLLSDGELNEGSTWEAILFASHHKLDNLIAIVDYNKSQAMGEVRKVLRLGTLSDKWKSFGWNAWNTNGHKYKEIEDNINNIQVEGNPSCIIAHTTKGKGVSYMEGETVWHYRSPNDEELNQALLELGVKR